MRPRRYQALPRETCAEQRQRQSQATPWLAHPSSDQGGLKAGLGPQTRAGGETRGRRHCLRGALKQAAEGYLRRPACGRRASAHQEWLGPRGGATTVTVLTGPLKGMGGDPHAPGWGVRKHVIQAQPDGVGVLLRLVACLGL